MFISTSVYFSKNILVICNKLVCSFWLYQKNHLMTNTCSVKYFPYVINLKRYPIHRKTCAYFHFCWFSNILGFQSSITFYKCLYDCNVICFRNIIHRLSINEKNMWFSKFLHASTIESHESNTRVIDVKVNVIKSFPRMIRVQLCLSYG